MDLSSGSSRKEKGSVAPGPVVPQVPPSADQGTGDIADGEPPVVFYIPRREILQVVSAQTGLAIHKYDSVTNEDGLVKGCVVIDVPQIPGRPLETRRAFYGERKGDLDSALESAAELALRHLCDEYGIIVIDWNYSALVEATARLLVAQEFSFSRKMAELEALQEKAVKKKQRLDDLVQEVKDICLEFGDLLPVRPGGPCGFEYVGPASPSSGYDQLALDLVQLLKSACVE